jgi:long-chain acyl-CoA synthetase
LPGIFERFSLTVQRFPDLISLQIREDSRTRGLTFKEVHERAKAVGFYLSGIGIRKGDRVAIFAENSPEWGVAYLGIVSIGGVAVPLDAQYTMGEVENLLKDSESKAIFTSRALLPIVSESSTEVRIIPLDEPIPGLPPVEFPKMDDEDLASLLYTSGTTGIPKGVMLTHGNLLSNADSLIRPGVVSHNDHVLCILPLHHSYPFMVCFLVPILVGGRVTFLNSLKGPDIVKTIREEGVTVLVGVPQLYSLMRKGIMGRIESLPGWMRLVARTLFLIARETRRRTGINLGRLVFRKVHREFGRLRFFACGGARLDPSIAVDLEGLGFSILEGYGLTETSPVVTFNLPDGKRIGSVGRGIEGVEVWIENPDPSGVGEVAIKGPNVMKGYYKRPDLTAEAIRDGWFRSGDLGYIDPEGYLFITGRSKEVIVLSSGKNIYPEDVENHYLKSPYIKEICIVGIPDPHHPGSFEGIKALVFPNYERLSADGIANISEYIRWQIERLSATLPAHKRVSGFSVLREPLPRTHLGKIRRFMVKEPLPFVPEEMPLSDEDQRLMETDVARVVLHTLSSITDRRISMGSNLELDLGIDSLGRVEMTVAIEKAFGVSVPKTFPSEVATVKDVILKMMEFAKGRGEVEALMKPISWGDILQQPPPEDMIRRIGLERGLLSNLTLRLTVWLLYVIGRTLLRLEVKGIENIPKDRAFIVTPNHVSYIDGFVVRAALRRLPNMYTMGFRGIFRGPITSRFARWGRIIRIDADSGLSESLQASAYVLKEGIALMVFPEGGRSVDGRVMPFKKGIGILAKELNVPLVPTYIEGSFDVLPRGAWLPRLRKVKVTFGEALDPEDIKELDYQGIADRLRERVISLKA